eukprot:TRINITY_DN10972_c0_g1_i2.p2 TRINITY_DN10972_c0_g1~~TRINITY_DN10972_c0_g1_i2.p2  ORF type:complete len:191 (-),score=-10.77 TRINITY_DN10972_c0_g1_i2:327-899(-)
MPIPSIIAPLTQPQQFLQNTNKAPNISCIFTSFCILQTMHIIQLLQKYQYFYSCMRLLILSAIFPSCGFYHYKTIFCLNYYVFPKLFFFKPKLRPVYYRTMIHSGGYLRNGFTQQPMGTQMVNILYNETFLQQTKLSKCCKSISFIPLNNHFSLVNKQILFQLHLQTLFDCYNKTICHGLKTITTTSIYT